MVSVNTLIVLFISVLGTSIISGIIGMGGGALLLAIMTFYFTLDVIVPIHGMIQLSANSSRVYMLRKNLNWKIIWPCMRDRSGSMAVCRVDRQKVSGRNLRRIHCISSVAPAWSNYADGRRFFLHYPDLNR